jgi:hypothetical protein
MFREGKGRFVRMVSRRGRRAPLSGHARDRQSLPRGFRGRRGRLDRGSRPARHEPELILPITYYFQTQGYRPKGYSVMTHERPGLHAGGVWNQTCIFCHNTVPWFDTLAGRAGRAFAARLPGRASSTVCCRLSGASLPGDERRSFSQGRRREEAFRRWRAARHRRRSDTKRRPGRHPRPGQPVSGPASRRGRHRLRGLPRRRPRTCRRSARAHLVSPRAPISST